MFNLISFENGKTVYFEGDYSSALNYAESCNYGEFTIEEYEDEEEYLNSL